MTLSREIHPMNAARVPLLTHSPKARAYLIRLSLQSPLLQLGHYDENAFYLTDYGNIVADEWVRLATNRKGITLDQWTITPDSLQGIVFVQIPPSTISRAGLASAISGQKPWLLSSFIASFKAAAAKRINLRNNQPGQPVWQRSYQEHLIDDSENALNEARDRLTGGTRPEGKA